MQGDLFGTAEAPELLPWQRHEKPTMAKYQEHSQNSVDAALAINSKASSIRARIFSLLKDEALTDQQIAKRLDLDPSTARPRRIELTHEKRVVEAGKALGRYASTWKAA